MKRLNDLLAGTEDIKVKSVETDSIVASDNTPLISYEGEELKIGYDSGNSALLLYAINNIVLSTEENGILSIDDEGFVINVPYTVRLTTASFYFSSYPTAERPANKEEGAVIYDETLKKCILYNGTAWVNLDGTALA